MFNASPVRQPGFPDRTGRRGPASREFRRRAGDGSRSSWRAARCRDGRTQSQSLGCREPDEAALSDARGSHCSRPAPLRQGPPTVPRAAALPPSKGPAITNRNVPITDVDRRQDRGYIPTIAAQRECGVPSGVVTTSGIFTCPESAPVRTAAMEAYTREGDSAAPSAHLWPPARGPPNGPAAVPVQANPLGRLAKPDHLLSAEGRKTRTPAGGQTHGCLGISC